MVCPSHSSLVLDHPGHGSLEILASGISILAASILARTWISSSMIREPSWVKGSSWQASLVASLAADRLVHGFTVRRRWPPAQILLVSLATDQ